MKLPFWDDFSFTQEQGYPNDTLWVSRKKVWVSNGTAINPPSIFTAAFDGINDSTAKPYNLTEVLARGFADNLTSRPIRLDLVPADQLETVYLSFFYQVTGNGEAPDKDDNFSLWFKDVNGKWENIFEVGNSLDLNPEIFYYKNIKVDPRFFHHDFQFKFQNFGRLSGPYDNWNLDYIYLNKRRTANEIYFHDQTLAKPLTSIFKKYTSIPIKHYKDTAASVTIAPKATFYSLYILPFQPFKYSTSFKSVTKKNGVTSPPQEFIVEADKDPNILIPHFKHLEVELAKTLPFNSLDLTADSIAIDFKLGFASGDTNTVAETPFYFPIDFTKNDTIHSYHILAKHYAYDDGSAEYGAGVNKSGAELAYLFDMFTKSRDTLVAVDIYFPEFGDNANRTVILKIWNNSSGLPGSIIHRQTLTVNRTRGNKLIHYKLSEPIGVRGKFFIGWEQTADVVVPVGLDKNTNSGEAMYYNMTGTWEQNKTLIGSLMIHPIFGKGSGQGSEQTGIADNKSILFPNPNQGEFFLPNGADHISITNMMGAPKAFELEQKMEAQRIGLVDRMPGLVIVRWQEKGKIHSARVLIRE